MDISVDVNVYVALIAHREDMKGGQAPRYEFVGVYGTFPEAVEAGNRWGNTHHQAADFSWHGPTAVRGSDDHKTALHIRRESV